MRVPDFDPLSPGTGERVRVRGIPWLAVLLLLAVAQPAHAQWPTVLMFYGPALKQPVFVTGADSVAFGDAFRIRTQGATADGMGDRPFVSVACFWGSPDDPAVNGVKKLTDLKPEMAWQHARFYPVTAGKPAMMFTTPLTKIFGPGRPGGRPVPEDARQFLLAGEVPAPAIAVLRKLGVPIGPTP